MGDLKLTSDDLSPFCEGFTKDQLAQALSICHEYQLTPLKRQIHFSLRNKRVGDNQFKKEMTYLVTVDGLRGIAERSDKYQGQVGPFWCGDDGIWSDVWLKKGYPLAAKVGVNKAGFREPLFAVAKFEEYSQKGKDNKPMQMWAKMPDLMVAKCAEALALRRAFPDETGGLYTVEEMQQAEQEKKPDFSMQSPDGMTQDEKRALFQEADEVLEMVSDEFELQSWFDQYHSKLTKNIAAAHMKKMNDRYSSVQQALLNKATKEKI